MGHFIAIIGTVIKSSLDSYVLPGTASGTEILWLYLIQWKRDLVVISSVTILVLTSACEVLRLQRVLYQERRPGT